MTVWGSRRDAEEARAKFVADVGGSRAADIGGAMTVDGLFER